MKKFFNKNSLGTIFVLTVSACLSILFFIILNSKNDIFSWLGNLLAVLSPVFVGIVIAYLLDKPVIFFQQHANKLVKDRIKGGVVRALCIVFVYLILLVSLALLSMIIFPQIVSSLTSLSNNTHQYLQDGEAMLNDVISYFGIENSARQMIWSEVTKLFEGIEDIIKAVVPFVINISGVITAGLFNLFLGLILSIYILIEKETLLKHSKRLIDVILPKRVKSFLGVVFEISNYTFSKFIITQFINALIVGMLCFIIMSIANMPFALLISVIMTVMNLIPMVGAAIGMVPCTFILLMEANYQYAIAFLIMIIILQAIDGNIIQPKIVSDSIGLSGFWVLVAILVGGGLFGFMGILICVPMLSVIFKCSAIFLDRYEEHKKNKEDEKTQLKTE